MSNFQIHLRSNEWLAKFEHFFIALVNLFGLSFKVVSEVHPSFSELIIRNMKSQSIFWFTLDGIFDSFGASNSDFCRVLVFGIGMVGLAGVLFEGLEVAFEGAFGARDAFHVL